MEPRSSQSTEQCFWVCPAKTHRLERSPSWAARDEFAVGRVPERFGSGSEGDRENVASKNTGHVEGLHAFRDDDLAGNSGCGRFGLAAMLADSLAYMQGSEYDFVAQQKAEEAAESIY